MMSLDKQEFELGVFNEFLRVAGFDADSIRQLGPPNPDITCVVESEERGFELTSLTDGMIEAKVRRGRSGFSNFRIGIDDVIDLIRNKSAKKYRGEHIDLVIHEGAAPIDGLEFYDQSHWDRVQAAADASQFATIWLLDATNGRLRQFQKS